MCSRKKNSAKNLFASTAQVLKMAPWLKMLEKAFDFVIWGYFVLNILSMAIFKMFVPIKFHAAPHPQGPYSLHRPSPEISLTLRPWTPTQNDGSLE